MSDEKLIDAHTQFDTPVARDDTTWSLLLALMEARRNGFRPMAPVGCTLAPDGNLSTTAATDPDPHLIWDDAGLRATDKQDSAARDLVELYAPLFRAGATGSLVIGHLGQSIDAQIATQSGDSCFVTGRENIIHLHRMRALCDAVIVGASTVTADDPRLTTRLVEGRNPVRVVIDPNRRVSTDLRLFNDGEAPTLIVCAEDKLAPDDDSATVIGIARDEAGLALPALVSTLRNRGLQNVFIEGGGITVSRWMTAGLLDRLHVAVAPVFIGDGRRALALPPAARMASCLRPPARVFRLGEDLLWDFDLRRENQNQAGPETQPQGPCRVL
jgi:riboflavin-specific deaminase-like protein